VSGAWKNRRVSAARQWLHTSLLKAALNIRRRRGYNTGKAGQEGKGVSWVLEQQSWSGCYSLPKRTQQGGSKLKKLDII